MYNLLIVDSKKQNHQKIKHYLDNARLEFVVVGEVFSAEEAEVILHSTRIDLIISDNQLPKKNGLQLFYDNKNTYPYLHIILFTNYNQFSNSKEIMSDGRIDFIFKPVRHNDVTKSLMAMQNLIRDFHQAQNTLKQLRISYDTHVDVFKDIFLMNLVHGHLDDSTNINRQFKHFNVQIEHNFAVGLFKIDHYKQYQLALNEDEKQFFIFKILTFIKDFWNTSNLGVTFINRYDEICFIISHHLDKDLFINHCQTLQTSLFISLNIRGTIGLGSFYSESSSIHLSYNQARVALRHHSYLGTNSVIHIDYTPAKSDQTYHHSFNKEYEMISEVIHGNIVTALDFLNTLMDSTLIPDSLPNHYYSMLIMDLLISIHKSALKNGVPIDNFFDDYIDFNAIGTIKDSYAAKAYLNAAIVKICNHQIDLRRIHKNRLLDHILDYVNTYYASKISLKRAAKYLQTTPNYLEEVIFSEYDKTFYDFCISVRLIMAKELLDHTNYTTQEISIKVGFNSIDYFNAIFKQHIHITPLEYRHRAEPLIHSNITPLN